jgi:hypothetical protein
VHQAKGEEEETENEDEQAVRERQARQTEGTMNIRRIAATVAVPMLLLLLLPSVAAANAPWWHLGSGYRPSSTEPESKGEVSVMASNLGDAVVNGESNPVMLTDKLPSGLRPVAVKGFAGNAGGAGPVLCPSSIEIKKGATLSCTFSGALPSYSSIELVVEVEVEGNGVPAGAVNEAAVSGGGARTASVRRPVHVGEPRFGVEEYDFTPEEADGALSTQAGAHPFQLTSTLMLSQKLEENQSVGKEQPVPAQIAKDLHFRSPAGLVGDPTAVPRCPLGQFLSFIKESIGGVSACPSRTAIGVARVLLNEPAGSGTLNLVLPVFNLEPALGEPARFGFMVLATPVILDASIRSGEDYGVTINVSNIAQTVGFLESQVTLWGDPGDPRHDSSRGYGCLAESLGSSHLIPCQASEQQHPPAFLSLPTSCTGPMQSTVEADSWAAPDDVLSYGLSEPMPALEGCNRLPFKPSIKVTSDGAAASTPTGLDVDVHVPQEESLNAEGLAESDPRTITVALPEGVQVNPSSGDGLETCAESLVGFIGEREFPLQPGVKALAFTPHLPGSNTAKEAGEASLLEPGINFCANASKIATAKITTPLLSSPLEGAVYLGTQNQNPFGSLLAMYIVAEDPEAGVAIKLPGQVSLCDASGETIDGIACRAPGQLIATFQNSPQAPFEDAELHFFGGERAPLASPTRCGAYTTTAVLTPWSVVAGEPAHTASSTFDVTSGPNGTPCPGAKLPFSPSLTGGATNIDAGNFSPLTTTMARADGEQSLESVQLRFPAGLSGLLSGVTLCPEAQANEGTCGPESLIGETTVAAGVGNDPVSVKGGKVYITEKYDGAPFGLSIVNPVKAGPFDLEHDTSKPATNMPSCDCVIVRAKIEVNPSTAALTVTTDPSGPHAIPHFVDGIPVQIKKVNVLINRPSFIFNPTSCQSMKIEATIASDEGASSSAVVPFQVANCRNLAFTPSFKAQTSGKTSKADGTSLHVAIAYPKGSLGGEANLHEVKVELPKQLPSRLSTLQKACTAKQFAANPAGCPADSIVGHAKAITPVLPVPLEGPAYFVSFGAAKFPELVLVLQGDGVTVDLHGETFISKQGITSSTFHTVPDQPVGSFELTLPAGPYSALTNNGNLCHVTNTVTVKKRVKVRRKGHTRTITRKVKKKLAGKLLMPTTMIAQNGAELHQSTVISVSGCGKR